MTVVFMAVPGTIDNFLEYMNEQIYEYGDSSTLMQRFEDDKEAQEYARKIYEAGLDTFTVICNWHSDDEEEE